MGPGGPLGEIAALSPTGVATADVYLLTAVELVSISREDFRSPTGIFRGLNPDPSSDGPREGADAWSVVRQKCTLIQSVAGMRRLSRTRPDIAAAVAEIRG